MPDLSHEEKDELISLLKKALEFASARLGCYEGQSSPHADPEEWIKRAYLSTQMTGWKPHDQGI